MPFPPLARRSLRFAPFLVFLLVWGAGFAVRAHAASPLPVLPVVEHLDWERYLGRWYEVARLPNSFQRKCVADITADYEALPDGRLRVVNQCRRDDREVDVANGEARQVQGDVGKLKVRFAPRWLAWVPAVWGDYWVIAVDDDYRTALVGTPDREYLWLLSRAPQRPSADIDAWLQRAAAVGFDTSRVVLSHQSGTEGADVSSTTQKTAIPPTAQADLPTGTAP